MIWLFQPWLSLFQRAIAPLVTMLSVECMQGDVDWGREAWMSAATEPSHVTGSQQEGKAAVTPQSDDTNLTSTPDPLKLTALWADSAGLLILYFTCVLPSKQVRQ